MTQPLPSIVRRTLLHRSLLCSAAVAALVAAVSSDVARAQGVNGTGQVVTGAATITNTPNQTTVVTGGNQTIINWRPNDTAPTGAPIDFLPAAGRLTFYGTGNYTVLNRFAGFDPITGLAIPIARQIQLAGQIDSFIGSPISPVGNVQGGNIWFYNAGGFLINSTGVINVGSLVLTANDIDTTGGLLGPGGSIRFRGATGSTSAVQIDGGARLSVSNPVGGGAYMAVVAPRVVQRGVVDVDGSVAYVAAEQADVTINNGLFDINVLVGAEGGTVIDHSGTTTGTAQRDADGRDSRIYMVAMPKNDAVTMLVAGLIGYRDPVTAQVEPNGAIRLAAGYNVVGGDITQNPGSTAPANITIQDSIFYSQLNARASNDLSAAPVATIPAAGPAAFVPPPQLGLLRFNQNASLSGDNSARVSLANQQALVAVRDLTIVSGGRNGAPGLSLLSLLYNPAQPGSRPLAQVGGRLTLDSSLVADPFAGSGATAGVARISVNGGTLAATDVELRADGTAGFGNALQGGIGVGGTTEFLASGAGTVVNLASLRMNADGRGGGTRFNANLGVTEVSNQGGRGNGGMAFLGISGGAAFTAQQGLSLSAAGFGGTGVNRSGDGSGGVARLAISGATSRVTTPFTLLDTLGSGGGLILASPTNINSAQGGDGFGGLSEIVSDGAADLGDTFLYAEGVGGNASANPNRGGDGIGGTANVLVSGGVAQMTGLTIDVDGLAGGGTVVAAATASTHGVGRGGTSAVRADAGTITINGDATVTGNGNTAAGGGVNTLERRGGSAEFRASNNGNILVAGTIRVKVDAGFDPGLGVLEGSNLNATGGNVIVSGVSGGTVSALGLDLRSVAATASATGPIGSATGGAVTIEARGGGRVLSGVRGSFINVSAIGGSGPIGGQGVGGRIDIIADGGRVDLSGFSRFDASGISGVSNGTVAGAIGQGGSVRFQTTANASPSEITFGDLIINVDGATGEIIEGGAIVGGNVGGDGRGGTFIVDMAGGSIVGGSLDLVATGYGGITALGQGGGNGIGGSVDLNLSAGLLDVDTISLRADGRGRQGGSNQRGGFGTGGRITVNVAGATVDTNVFDARAGGYGGAGRDGADNQGTGGALIDAGDGGTGIGGTIVFNANSGIVRAGTLRIDANAEGGNGGSYDGTPGGSVRDTGDGGTGQGGSAIFNLRGAQVTTTRLEIVADGRGGSGGMLLNAAGLAGIANGGDGGIGTGGQATFRIAGNVGTIMRTSVSANGNGGAGATGSVGGDGGAAQGGTAQMVVDNVDAGDISAQISVEASGGNGGAGYNGAGGDGGNGSAGTARVITTGGGAAVQFDPGNLRMEFFGGRGGNSARDAALPAPVGGANGGNGGQGFGGTAELLATGGTLTLDPRAGGNAVEMFVYGGGGTGGNSGASDRAGNGGNSTGNMISLLAQGGTITSRGAPVQITNDARTARGGMSASGVSGNAGSGSGGTIAIRAEAGPAGNGAINLGPTTLIAASANGGRIDLRSRVAGDGLIIARLTATANGTPLVGGGPALGDSGIYVEANQGRVVVNGAAQFDTASSATFAAQGSGNIFVGGNLSVNAAQRIDITHANRTGSAATIRATGTTTLIAGTNLTSSNGLSITSGGTLLAVGNQGIALGDVTGTGNVSANSSGNVTLGRATTTGNLAVQAGGAVTLTGAADAGGSIMLRGASLNFGALTAANAIDLNATAAGIGSAGVLRAGTDLTVNAAGTIAIADARAGDDIRLTGTSMTLGDLRATGTGADNEGDGSDFVLTATGDVAISHAEARSDFRANAIRFATGLNSIVTGGDIIVDAVNTIDLGNSTAGGQITATGSQIAFNTLTAGTDVRLTTVPGQVRGPSGPLGDGSIVGASIGAGGLVNANALGRIQLGTATAGSSATLVAGADIGFNRVTSGTALSVDAASGITGQRFNAGGNAALVARGGNIVLTDTNLPTTASGSGGNLVMRGAQVRFGAINVTGNADIDAATLLSGSALTVGGTTVLDADSGTIDLTLASAGAVTATADRATLRGAGGALTFTRITTDVDGATITNSGDIIVQNATLARASRIESTSGNVTLNQTGVTGGNLVAVANRGLTLGAVSASGDIDATAGRTLVINGAVTAANIRAASADITIGTNGRIGTLGTTQAVTLTNNDRSATAFVGGTGTRNGWHLDSGEVARLFGTNITIDAGRVTAAQSASVGSTRAPDVFVDDFTVNAAQQFGPTGTFAITTPGKLRVVGDARFTNMADGQSVRIRADDALEVIMGDGSLVLTGAGTDLGGVLRLQSEDVIVATLRAIADVAAAPTVAAINDRLAQNDGITSDLGALAAKGIDVTITRGFYVQNSGTPGLIPGRDYANRRGLSFGALGLNITTRDATNRIILNGQQLGGLLPVTGLDMIPLIAVGGVVGATNGFDAASTANGCIIINVGPCRFNPDDGGFPLRDTLGDDGEPGEDGVGADGVRPVPLITLRGLDPLSGEPLIDDPVTGAGNEDLWIPTE